ncbi:ObirObp6 [Ooceraea biroi]|uniref:ObirObp6 n=1 Tax=Ooceraea biroi TaxID=2015173 RepID=A0A3L8DQC6_OOCBI|nr:uncharacterized protein LOC105287744 [Ooceraea biroi]RLU22476.1 ObirObp6 [Ooceraea biroi]
MKNIFLLVVSVLFAVNLHYAESKRLSLDEIKDALRPVKDICIQRVGVSLKMVDDASAGKFANDRKLKCYYKCMMIMTKAMRGDEIMAEQFLKITQTMLKEELVDPMLEAMIHCAPIANKPLEGCDLAFELVKCLYDYDPKLLTFP